MTEIRRREDANKHFDKEMTEEEFEAKIAEIERRKIPNPTVDYDQDMILPYGIGFDFFIKNKKIINNTLFKKIRG